MLIIWMKDEGRWKKEEERRQQEIISNQRCL